MNNKFSKNNISRFDPTYASDDAVRAWLFAIIDSELEKPTEERDIELISDCSECEAALSSSDHEIYSPTEITAQIKLIKKRAASKNINNKKKSIRIVAIIAATLTVALLSLGVAAASMEGTFSWAEFFDKNINTIKSILPGQQFNDNDITVLKQGKITNYSSIRDAVADIEYDVLYPSYLPKGIKIERISIVCSAEEEKPQIIFVTNDIQKLSMSLTVGPDILFSDTSIGEIYSTEKADVRIVDANGKYQSYFIYKDNSYAVLCYDRDELIKILDGMTEVE